jgi:hypothetical protein
VRGAASCAGTRKILREGSRRIGSKVGVIRKRVRAGEDSWEEVEDAVEVKVEAKFPVCFDHASKKQLSMN